MGKFVGDHLFEFVILQLVDDPARKGQRKSALVDAGIEMYKISIQNSRLSVNFYVVFV